MEKYSILKEIFDIETVDQKILKFNIIFSANNLLDAISKTKYNLSAELPASAATITKALAKIFPDRPKTTNKLDNWLLSKYSYKQCKECLYVKEFENFHKNSNRSDGLNSYCKTCQNKLTAVTSAERQARYKAAKLQRIPCWLTLEELELISKFYAECPEGHQVDHIIPLQGVNVSGLHTLSNLQYLTATENNSKRNKFMPT